MQRYTFFSFGYLLIWLFVVFLFFVRAFKHPPCPPSKGEFSCLRAFVLVRAFFSIFHSSLSASIAFIFNALRAGIIPANNPKTISTANAPTAMGNDICGSANMGILPSLTCVTVSIISNIKTAKKNPA